MRTLGLVALGLVFVACSAPQEAEVSQETGAAATARTTCPAMTAGRHEGFQVSSLTRSFEVLLPPASFTGPRPLLMAYHGTGESGAGFIARAQLQDFANRGFVVVAPDAANIGSFWPVWDSMRLPSAGASDNADDDLFDALVGCASSGLSIDDKRIFVAGHSAGGIATNHFLRSRSNVLAGGIPASGVFDLTEPGAGATPPSDMFIIVTWGGDNDQYSGSTPTGVHVPSINFVEQASLASEFYAAQPTIDQVRCRGNDIGHQWLLSLNDWYIDLLLAHPKGTAPTHTIPVPTGAPVVCSTDAYQVPPLPPITCPATPRAGCEQTCQLMADCAADNRTVGPALGDGLAALGFSGDSCGGCVQRCELGGTTQDDADVLSCISDWSQGTTCSGGIEGAFPMFLIMNQCCSNKTGSNLCKGLCQSIGKAPSAAAFFPVCQSF
jgi:poly(3-hydroxybutyrate) depolymerase